jgi:hydroxyethylthiazole kinase
MFKEMLENVRKRDPLVHNITNYVTAGDCANILIACGASPIMADDAGEAAEITSVCQALNINIGTLNQRTIPAMLSAGTKANARGIPVVFDPVGVGASSLRNETAAQLFGEMHFTVIRGNASEIRTLAGNSGTVNGVDANAGDKVSDANLGEAVAFAKAFASKSGAVVVMTGAIDIAASAKKAYVIRNGDVMMSKITGSGCMLSAMTAAYLGANPDKPLEAAAAATCAMGLCGEIAFSRMKARDGSASYRNYLIDAVFNLDGADLDKGAKYEIK